MGSRLHADHPANGVFIPRRNTPHLPYVIVYKETNGDLDIIGVFHTSLHPETKRRRLDA